MHPFHKQQTINNNRRSIIMSQIISVNLYYERKKKKPNSEEDPRKNACFLSCEDNNGRFDHLLQVCSGMAHGTEISIKSPNSICLLPSSFEDVTFGNASIPLKFKSFTVSPFDKVGVHIFFETSFELLGEGKPKCDLHNFLYLLLCAVESSWKEKPKNPYVTKLKKGRESSWRRIPELGWRYGCGSSNPLDVVTDIVEVLEM